MKKSTAGFALSTVVAFSALSATPAMAATLPFPNCSAAEALGVFNIPEDSPGYGPHLDADDDGFGCDAQGTPPYDPTIMERLVNTEPAAMPEEDQQVAPMPEGGVDTGVTQESSTYNLGLLALGGGLVLTTAAGGTYMVRRRNAD